MPKYFETLSNFVGRQVSKWVGGGSERGWFGQICLIFNLIFLEVDSAMDGIGKHL